MKEQKMGTCCICDQETSYWLLEERAPSGCNVYGIAVEENGERAMYRGLSVSYREVCKLLESLAYCGVTLVTVTDIVEDWLLR